MRGHRAAWAGRAAAAIATGRSFTCALLRNGSVACWGWNAYGQLGIGSSTTSYSSPESMGDALRLVDLGPGLLHCAALAQRAVEDTPVYVSLSSDSW